MALRSSEYGGSDTLGTRGIQPEPHVPNAFERMRLLYATSADTETSGEDITGLIGQAG